MDGWTYVLMDGWMDRWMDGQMDVVGGRWVAAWPQCGYICTSSKYVCTHAIDMPLTCMVYCVCE